MFHAMSSLSTRFLHMQPWHAHLGAEQQARLQANVTLLEGRKGEVMLRSGEPVQGWYGVVAGLVKLQSSDEQGRCSAFVGVPSGQWFGEGSALKREVRRYEVIALRDTTLLCLPCAEFELLFNSSLPFNQALVRQLNMRVGQAMAAIEAVRTRTPEQRVALHLSRLFWHGMQKLDLSQEELSNLAGLSRQTVNRALQTLEKQGLVSLDFGRISVLSDEGLTALAFGASA